MVAARSSGRARQCELSCRATSSGRGPVRTHSLAEFYRLSMPALAALSVVSGALTPDEAGALIERPTDTHFLGCGFAYIGAWGRRRTLTTTT
jgi:hypothetical protein